MELRRYLAILRRRALFIVLTAVVAVGVSWVTTDRSSTYTTTSTLYVGSRQFDTGDRNELSSDRLAALNSVLLTYASMIDSRPIAQDAIDRLGLHLSAPAVVARTQTGPMPRTQLLLINVTDRSPVVARDLANALADAFVERVQEFEGGTTPGEEGDLPTGLPAYVFERAALPTTPQSVGLLRNLVLAGLFGLLAAAALVLFVEYLDVTIKTANEAERRLDLPVLGVIPLIRHNQNLAATVRRSARSSHLHGAERPAAGA